MRNRLITVAVHISLGVVGAAFAFGQSHSDSGATGYSVPHTPDGQPDLQGTWTNVTVTPLERPRELAGKEFFTAQESAEYEKQTLFALNSDRKDVDDAAALDRPYNESFRERGAVVPSRRTSLIVDTPDGRIPPLTPQGQVRVAARAEERKLHGFDGPENRSPLERCIVAPQAGPPMMPGSYNSNYQIVQAPGYVLILSEEVHDVRVIPLDGRPHLSATVRQWMGDSRGHWEGNTLVVETANFAGVTSFAGSGPGLRLVERFTRTGPDLIMYEFVIDDPATFVRPWTVQLPLRATSGPIFEYACHEGNYALANVLSGARAEEKAAAEGAKSK